MNLSFFDDSPKESKKSAKTGFTSQQLKMIQWYAEQHNFGLALSTPPATVEFVQENGEHEQVLMSDITDAYKSAKKEEAQERTRAKKSGKPVEVLGRYL